VIAFDQTSLMNNVRRWGLISEDGNSGIYFELLDGVLYAVTMYDGTPTKTNIDYFKPTNGNMNRWQILMTGARAQYFIGDILVAELNNSGVSDLPVTFRNETTGVAASPANLVIQVFAFYQGATVGNQIIDPVEGNVTRVTKSGRLLVRPPAALKFIQQFYNDDFDIVNVWTETIVGSATRVVTKNMLTQTEPQQIDFTLNFGGTLSVNNRREWGSKDGNNGIFFRVNDLDLETVILDNGTEIVQSMGPAGILYDDKFHTFQIKRLGQSFVWFYIDETQVGFFAATGNQPLLRRVDDHPYIANYNVGVTTVPCIVNCLGIFVADEASSSTAIQGTDVFGTLRNVGVDAQGRLRTAPFGVIQTTITYTGNNVTQLVEVDEYGNTLTTNYAYTGKKVTSISQVAS
jgi:hypothetical protein